MIEVNEQGELLLEEERREKRTFDPLKLHKIPDSLVPENLVPDNIEELTTKQIKGKGRPTAPRKPFEIVELDDNNNLQIVKKRGHPSKILSMLRTGKVSEETLYQIASCYYYNPDWKTVAVLTGHTAEFLLTFAKTLKFHDLLAKVRDELDKKEEASATNIVDTTLVELKDRLDYGDDILDSKTGKIVKIKPKAKELASILKTVHTVRQITRGEATSLSEKISPADRLNKLAEQFTKFAAAKDITPEK